jgi:hypothetical protein
MPKIMNWSKYEGSSFNESSLSSQGMVEAWSHYYGEDLFVEITSRKLNKKSMGGRRKYAVKVQNFNLTKVIAKNLDSKEKARKKAVKWMRNHPVRTQEEFNQIFNR